MVNSNFIFNYKNDLEKDENIINETNLKYVKDFFKEIINLKNLNENSITEVSNIVLKKNNIKFKDLGQPLRLILTNSLQAPSIKDIVKILGVNETINRLKRHLKIRQ